MNSGTKINYKLLIPVVIILIIILTIVGTNLTYMQENIGNIYNACIKQFGWFFVLTDLLCLIFAVWLMLGPYRDIKLGGEECKPAFSTASWSGMMFTTSCGAWLIVYGFLEPIYCADAGPFQFEPMSVQAMEFGQAFAHFHWGPNAWGIYVPISVAIGYALYNRKKKKSSLSEACGGALKNKSGKVIGYCADLFGTLGAVVAPVISIGTGMPLLVVLVRTILGISNEYDEMVSTGILLIWIAIFGTSVFLGLQKGIKKLSNFNIIMAFILMAFVGLLLGLTKVFASEINTVGVLLNNYIRMSTYTDPFGDGNFVNGWTFGYWACYFVFMPLMGVFNAKISKGRRLKEIAFGQLVICTLGCWCAMATFGNYSMKLQATGKVDIASIIKSQGEAEAVKAVLSAMPFPKIMMVVLLIALFIFLATTMDSSAFAVAELTCVHENENDTAPRWLRLFWAVFAALIAFVILKIEGAKTVRSLCYIMGLPLAVISIIIIASTIKMLREDHAEECESDKPLTIFKRQ